MRVKCQWRQLRGSEYQGHLRRGPTENPTSLGSFDCPSFPAPTLIAPLWGRRCPIYPLFFSFSFLVFKLWVSNRHCPPLTRRAGESCHIWVGRENVSIRSHRDSWVTQPHIPGVFTWGGGTYISTSTWVSSLVGGSEGVLGLEGRTDVHGNSHQAHMVNTTGQPLTRSVEATPSPPSTSRQTV